MKLVLAVGRSPGYQNCCILFDAHAALTHAGGNQTAPVLLTFEGPPDHIDHINILRVEPVMPERQWGWQDLIAAALKDPLVQTS